MERPKKSDYPKTRAGAARYTAALKAWKAKQPKKKSWGEVRDAQRTAWEKERKSRNPEQLKVSYNKKTRKVERKVVPNPNYKRPTKGQKGYSPDATSNPRKEVDMEAIKKIVAKQKGESKEKQTTSKTIPSNPQLHSQKKTKTDVRDHDTSRHKTNKVVKKDKPKSLRSGVFTKDPKTGKALGVMTRNQRAAWDKKNQTYLQEQLKKKNFRDYGKHGKRYG